MASMLLAAMLTISLQMLSAKAAQQRSLDRRQIAAQQAANVMEHLAAVPWDELTPESARQLQLPEQAPRALPNGQLEIEISSPPEEPDAKRVTVEIRWRNGAGKLVSPVRLVTWRFREIEG